MRAGEPANGCRVKPRALDLFCGAGGAGMGLSRAGFSVHGVDIKRQPHYPFPFWCHDVLRMLPIINVEFIWASPPCQAFTKAQRLRKNAHPDLIEATRKILRRAGVPYCIENVPGAPLENPIELCGSMFGLRTYRHRVFECSFPLWAPPHPTHDAKTTKMGRPAKGGEFMHVVGNFSGVDSARKAMDIDWMTRDELREAIPPAYSEFIGRAALQHMQIEVAA